MSFEGEQTEQSLEELRARLDQTEEALRAIRHGEVDALVVWTTEGDRIFTLQGADFVYKTMVEAMSEGAGSVSADGVVLYANHRLAEMVATPLEEIVGGLIDRLVAPDDQLAFERLLARAAVETSRGEIRLRANDGTLVPTHVSLTPLPLSSGAAISLLATDLTERQRAEDELRALSAELEARVRDRTAELESFVTAVSHDLRAPLRAIDGFSRLVEEEEGESLSPLARERLARVRANTHHITRLVDELLKLSRVGRRELELERVDISALAAQVADELCADRPERRTQIAIEAGMAANIDRDLVQTLLRNLLDNALKFTSKRASAHIEVGLRDQNGVSLFYVHDNGVGFDTERSDELFRPFRRLHGTAEYAGLGIGLATVKRVVDRVGGRIWARSSPGEGTTFAFTLAPGAPGAPGDDAIAHT
jgi:PAS domain S-box-containing protein